MNLDQFKIYCRAFDAPFIIEKGNTKLMKGLGGNVRTIGSANIPIPLKNIRVIIDIKFHIIMQSTVPSLLSNRDMIVNGLDLDIQEPCLIFEGKKEPLELKDFFLIYNWSPEEVSYSLYTEIELRKLHRSFGYPSVNSLLKVLKIAGAHEVTSNVKKVLKEITQECKACAEYASKPKRFQLTVGRDELRFNHGVVVDLMWIENRPVLHIVDEATHFAAACFLHNVSTETVWKSFLKCWSRVYLDPPDFIRADQGTQLVSKEFLQSCEADGIRVVEAPTESSWTLSHVERYHGPLRNAYKRIRAALTKNVFKWQ